MDGLSLPQDAVQYKYINWHTSQLHMWPRDTSLPPNEIGFCYIVLAQHVGDNISRRRLIPFAQRLVGACSDRER